MKRSTPPWSLNPDDVYETGSTGGLSGRAKRRYSRALDLRACAMTLTHHPTGAAVAGTIPTGHYARKEMVRLQAELRVALFRELESKVARLLRIPGR